LRSSPPSRHTAHHKYLDEVVEWNHLGFDGEEITWQ